MWLSSKFIVDSAVPKEFISSLNSLYVTFTISFLFLYSNAILFPASFTAKSINSFIVSILVTL